MTKRRRKRGAIYARFSSRFQHSTKDQIAKCLQWAEANDVEVLEEHIYVDEKQTGRATRRTGFQALKKAIEAEQIDVLIIFSTSRLYRKQYRSLMFVEEEIVDRKMRAVFLTGGVDTDDRENWRKLLQLQGIIDELSIQLTVAHIQAAHEGQLRARVVFGTLTYGFTGEPIPDQTTKLGKPSRRLIIDPVTREWVERIFDWFVVERLSIRAIARRLNERGAPLPDRPFTDRWTSRIVRRILGNERYAGLWAYGTFESVWQNKADYSRGVRREKPLAEQTFEQLRIIPQERWLEAQRLLADYRDRAGRPPKDGDRKSRPRILNPYLFCEGHEDQNLHVGGTHGSKMKCPACLEGSKRYLFNALPRVEATAAVLGAIGGMAKRDTGLAAEVVGACQRHAQGLQKPDTADLEDKKRREVGLTRSIEFILASPGETEEDQAENQAKLTEFRRQRAALRAQIQQMESALLRRVEVPTEAQVRELIESLDTALVAAAHSDDPEMWGRARRIVEIVTGARIVVSQQGEAGTKRGWLRLSFKVDVLKLVLNELGAPAAAGEPVEVHLDIRRLALRQALADEVKALWDQDLLVKAIAKELSAKYGREISRNLVTRALNEWFTSRGLPVPDGRSRRATLKTKHTDPTLYQRMVGPVMQLFHTGLLYAEIAERLDLDRNTITAIVKRWHEDQGLPVPDGRSRRKGLDHKERGDHGAAPEAA